MAVKVDKAKDVEKYPYMVTMKYAEPAYYSYPGAARNRIMSILKSQKKQFFSLNNVEGMSAIEELMAQAGEIGDGGGVVEGVFDPFTGLTFKAEVVKRRGL